MGQALFRQFGLIEKFNIDATKLHNFLNAIEEGYHKDNPYHNNIHASDVAQSTCYLISRSGIKERIFLYIFIIISFYFLDQIFFFLIFLSVLTDLDRFAAVV